MSQIWGVSEDPLSSVSDTFISAAGGRTVLKTTHKAYLAGSRTPGKVDSSFQESLLCQCQGKGHVNSWRLDWTYLRRCSQERWSSLEPSDLEWPIPLIKRSQESLARKLCRSPLVDSSFKSSPIPLPAIRPVVRDNVNRTQLGKCWVF